jgi:hypothetical protein
VLGPDGRYVRTRPLPFRTWDRFAIVGDRFVGVAFESRNDRVELRLGGVARDTVEYARQTRPLRPVELTGCGTTMPMEPYLLPSLAWATSGQTVAVSSGPQYAFDIFRGERLVARVTRAVRNRRANDDDVRREAGDGMRLRGGAGCTIPPDVLIRGRGAAEVVPAIAQIAVDPMGRVWVRRWAPRGTPFMIDVYEQTGAYLGTLPAGTPFPLAFTAGDRFVSLETDADGVETLVLHRIERDRR